MDSLWGNIFKSKSQEKTIGLLRNIPIFKELGGWELATIEKALHTRQYLAEEVIFSQGVLGAGMYIIVQGRIRILDEPTGQVIAELGDGEFFGELALLDEAPRTATAVSVTPCTILGFFQSDLFGLTERNPRLGAKIVIRLARIIGQRLKASNDQIRELQSRVQCLTQEAVAAAEPPVEGAPNA